VSPGLTAQIIAIVTGRGIRWVAALRKIVAGRQPGCPAKACGAPRRKGGPALTAGEAATPPAEATRRLSQGTARRADDGDAQPLTCPARSPAPARRSFICVAQGSGGCHASAMAECGAWWLVTHLVPGARRPGGWPYEAGWAL
jgi:hypothetical protein